MADEPTSQANAPESSGFVGTPMGEGTAAPIPKPVEAPAPAPTQPQAPDYAALENTYRSLGDGYSIESGPSKIQDLKKGMSDSQRETADIRKRYEFAEPLVEHLQGTPGFADHMQRAANEFFTEEPNAAPQAQEGVRQALNPANLEIQQMKSQLASIEQNRQLEELDRQYPNTMTVETRNEIMARMHRYGGDASMHLFAIQGQAMLQQAKQTGADSVPSRVNYVQPPSGTYTAPVIPPTEEMTSQELDEYQTKRIAEIAPDA